MKNIDILRKGLEAHKDLVVGDLYIYDINRDDTLIIDIISEAVETATNITKNFSSIIEFVEWCNCSEEKYIMKRRIYDSLETFNNGLYGYICKSKNSVFIQSGENRALVDNEIVDLCLMGFEYDDFEFLELNKIYEIDDILENVYIVDEECGD